ncbi:NAD-dependent epimerase/dehydratase family protein [Saccharopolyspora spinosa]|uniref:RmlD substrate binding domain-containing protein n=1 Tax=Saccharopolyspora spinosa TaxID=60894 RepID=A0A2N3XUM2_SACSN|nr:NAD-dependent epimerase/dehydratase family protein [Saccharopolyspora spinosa]PKW14321.1 RmlD substrate binding domain-containing protein [Saccharopolyspora spinosa]
MIALLGATGAVGSRVLQALRAHGLEVHAGSRTTGVDMRDTRTLADFFADAQLVVNCAGPSHDTSEHVALAALKAGADHVDAGGDGVRLRAVPAGLVAVFAAGATPGLSGLLPRVLARGFGEVHTLTSYSGVLDRFSPAGAEDFLHGSAEAGAAWRDGARVAQALGRTRDIVLPHLPRPVVALPFLDEENVSVAREISLADGTWYTFVEDGHLLAALDRSPGLEPHDAIRSLCGAASLDVAGRTPYAALYVQIDGPAGTRTAIARADSAAEMTASVTVQAVLAVLRGQVPSGSHTAAEVLDPAVVFELGVVVEDRPIADLVAVEEGAL